MKNLMHEARNEQKIEESDKSKRVCNFIIHGADEVGSTPKEVMEEDAGYIKEILVKIGVSTTPNSIARLGDDKGSKKRPLKVVFKNVTDKD